jgi:hypothetical protein
MSNLENTGSLVNGTETQEAPAKKPRKQRSDKGKPRGPRKPKTEAAQ